jgi:hypothetical protein
MARPPDPRVPKTRSTRKPLLIGALILIVVGILVGVGTGFYQFGKSLDKYCGVRTSYDRSEVLYRLGYPPAVLDDSQKNSKYPGRRSYETNRKVTSEDPDKMMPAGKAVSDYFEWSYPLRTANNSSANVYIDFDRATRGIENIDCVDFTEMQHVCPALAGVLVGDSEDRVRDKLGRPDRYDLDGVTKTMSYDSMGVEFKLTKGNVYYLRLSGSRDRSTFRLFCAYVRSFFA